MGIRDLKKSLEKDFGEGIVTFLDDKAAARESYSTGVLSIDYSLVIGGYPKGFYTELYGKESSGKTTLAATAVAALQKATWNDEKGHGKFVLWLDYENSFDQVYFSNLGVKFGDENFMLAYPKTLEEGFRIILRVLQDKEIDVGMIVIDSLAIAAPSVDTEKLDTDDSKLGERRVGGTASTIAQILKQIQPIFMERRDVNLLIINQLRNVISSWITTKETTGGLALKYAFHVRQEIKRVGLVKEGGKPIGLRVKIKTIKSKVGVPLREVESDIIFGKGFDYAADAFGIALELGVLQKSGSMYALPESKWDPVRGAGGFRELYESDADYRAEIRKRVLACGAPAVKLTGADEALDRGIEQDGVDYSAKIPEIGGKAQSIGKPVDLSDALKTEEPKEPKGKKRGRPKAVKKEESDG